MSRPFSMGPWSAWTLFAALFTATGAQAQTTDAYHAIQVFPVVVDTASFAQQFHFRASFSATSTSVTVTYYPAEGTSQSGPLACPGFVLDFGASQSFSSLRGLCPGLPAGSAFGTLVARNDSGLPFSAASRIRNPAGNGFQVEAFAANEFTSATSVVAGLRRTAATAAAPAFQSNCFIGSLAELAPAGVVEPVTVTLTLASPLGAPLGQTHVSVQPGQLVRLLDVFAAAGVSGDVADATAIFSNDSPAFGHVGLVSFCTVQDNTSFGADFRIGKQESTTPWGDLGPMDGLANRFALSASSLDLDETRPGLLFYIPAGASRNVHAIQLRHPDYVSCGLLDGMGQAVMDGYGLEMRLRIHDWTGWWTIAGGDLTTQFSPVYLGDKRSLGNGANTTYLLEVESNGLSSKTDRQYAVACFSGSGSTSPILVGTGLPIAF